MSLDQLTSWMELAFLFMKKEHILNCLQDYHIMVPSHISRHVEFRYNDLCELFEKHIVLFAREWDTLKEVIYTYVRENTNKSKYDTICMCLWTEKKREHFCWAGDIYWKP